MFPFSFPLLSLKLNLIHLQGIYDAHSSIRSIIRCALGQMNRFLLENGNNLTLVEEVVRVAISTRK